MAQVTVTGFNMQLQGDAGNLCWAAVALSVAIWLKHRAHWTQLCQVVNDIDHPTPNCCPGQNLYSDACNVTGNVVSALQPPGLLGMNAGFPGSVGSAQVDPVWDLIKSEIGHQRVLCATILWPPVPTNGGHEIVISGYCDDNGGKSVYVSDPLFTSNIGWISYSTLISDYQRIGGKCRRVSTVKTT